VSLLLAAHPLPSVAVTGLATLLAFTAGAAARTAVLVAVAVLVGQLSVGWCNDWLDADRDLAAGRADKPVAIGRVTRESVRAAALVAVVVTVPLSLALGWRAGLAHLCFVASAWSYDVRLKSTVWSWAPYAVSFGILPDVVTLALPGHPAAAWWAVLAGALLGVGAHLINVLPDLEDDRATGVRGLPHALGREASAVVACVVLVAAAAVVAFAQPGAVGAGAWVALAVALAGGLVAVVSGGRGGRRVVPLAATAVVALAVVVLLVSSGAHLT
jgi:4-hydroxybenzoate polyprenyltransferase